MPQDKSQLARAVSNLAEAMLIDLPLLAIGRLFDRGFSSDLKQAGWKAYDATVAISTELTNRLYASPRIGRVSSRALEDWLNVQRLTSAASGAFFAALWPLVGLPTASEMQLLIDQVESLREQLQASDLAMEADPAASSADRAGEMFRFRVSSIEARAEVQRNVAH
jgi:hypothetical protein